ncbi:MAG: hypothetical protein ABIJ45_03680 [Candidatus Zixiibacteriota bacterium]
MKYKKNKETALIGLAMILVVLISGCAMTDGDDGIAGPPASEIVTINGVVLNMGTYEVEKRLLAVTDSLLAVNVSIHNASNIPNLKIDSFDLPVNLEEFIDGGRIEANRDGLPYPSDNTVLLSVNFTDFDGVYAFASALVDIPDTFSFIDSLSGGYIGFSDSLKPTWSGATRAEAYRLNILFQYIWLDTLGSSHNFRFNKDVIVFDTSYLIMPQDIFPDSMLIDNIGMFTGSINIFALSGSFLTGNGSNISGNASGTFLGATYGGGVTYNYGSAPPPMSITTMDKDRAMQILQDIN